MHELARLTPMGRRRMAQRPGLSQSTVSLSWQDRIGRRQLSLLARGLQSIQLRYRCSQLR
jgi:hypothetical protein